MKTEKQIKEVLSLHRGKVSIRKIADRLNMSPTTVHKYIKTASSGNATTNNRDIDWSKLFRAKPIESNKVQGKPSSEFPNANGHVQNYSTSRDDRPPRRREISYDPNMESNNYPEELNNGDQYYAPRRRDIPVPRRKKRETIEEDIAQIKNDLNDQGQTQKLQSLEKKLDRLIKLTREDRELEKKLNLIGEQKPVFDQNKRTGPDNLNKKSTTNQDKEIKILSHVTELKKTGKSIEQKNLTNHESTVADKNLPIHDSNNDQSAGLDTGMAFRLLAAGFEGLSPVIGSFIGQELYKVKHNKNTPKQVTLIPRQEVTLTPIIEVNLREVKKEEEIVLIPLDK